jgi:hypothetical protein
MYHTFVSAYTLDQRVSKKTKKGHPNPDSFGSSIYDLWCMLEFDRKDSGSAT